MPKDSKSRQKNSQSRGEGQSSLISNGLTEAVLGTTIPGVSEQLSQTDTVIKNLRGYFISNMRQILAQAYVEIGIIKTIVDIPVEDAMRGGVEIKSKELSPEDISALQYTIEQKDDLGIMAEELKWDRLFGGGGILILTGQDPQMPLDINSILPGDPLAFRAVDMWELFWDQQNTSTGDGPPIDGSRIQYYSYYGRKVHKSRVLITKGLIAPSLLRPRLRGWGMSVVETLIRSINQYLKANNLAFEVLDEFKIDIFKIKNLANTLLSPDGLQAIQKRIRLANQEKNFQNAVTMDAEDDYLQKELSFTGLAETMVGIRMQVASDLRMPLTKVFGISSAGFSSGEDDIENYNAMVESTIRTKCKHHLISMIKLRCQQLFGYTPLDLQVSFKPLRILSSEQEENVKTQKFNRILQARQAGEIDSKEFKDACNRDNLLGIQLDTTADTLEDQEEDDGDDDSSPEGDSESKAKKSKLAAKEAPEAKV